MTDYPNPMLLARAMSHLERAKVELAARNIAAGVDYIDKGLDLLKEAVQ